ncbi:MAG: RDD family protein [bacterium]
METVQIDTTQNVQIDYQVAGLGDRILAALFDYFILAGYIIGVSLLISSFGGFDNASSEGTLAVTTIILLPYLLYDLLCEVLMNGQSFGKKLLKIKVARLDGSQPGIGEYLLRWLLRFIDITMMSGAVAIVTILVNGKGQRLGDLAAGTTVIKLESAVRLEDTILTELDEDYEPVFPQALQLHSQDIATIKRVLRFQVNDPKMANHLLYKTKQALETKMGIESEMSAPAFLQTVLNDYSALVMRRDRG